MKLDRTKQTILALAVMVFGFAGVFLLSGFIEKNRPTLPEGFTDEDLALQSAKLKGFSLGFEGLIADWYWMQALQYIGEKVVKDRETNKKLNLENLNGLNPRLLFPLLDNAATLDPQFIAVYSYGAVVLPAIDPQQAIKLTEKGIESNPHEWRLYEKLGYIYWRLGDYERAAAAYEMGAKIPQAAQFMLIMATKMKSAGGDRETARAIYEQMLAESGDRQVRDNAALHLGELDSQDERDAIRSALQTFKTKTNRCANNWREILPLLQPVKLPNNKNFRADNAGNIVDPSGAPYLLDKENCDVKLDEAKTKIPFK